jgi:hypothetical protein
MFKLNYSNVSTVMFLTVCFTFPQSYTNYKLIPLAFFFITHIKDWGVNKKFNVPLRLIIFYFSISIISSIWSLIGLLNGGNIIGIFESIRLYVFWSVLLVLIYTLIYSADEIESIHKALILSGLGICLINLSQLYASFYQISLFSEGFVKELDIGIGFREGYIQITSQNIGSLLIIIPYLISTMIRIDGVAKNTFINKLILLLCIALAIVSGRRALWLSIALTPVIILLIAYLSGCIRYIKKSALIFIKLYILCSFVGLIIVLYRPYISTENGLVNHFNSAFASDDARVIQKEYLFESFILSPYIGSGYGVSTVSNALKMLGFIWKRTRHTLKKNEMKSGLDNQS